MSRRIVVLVLSACLSACATKKGDTTQPIDDSAKAASDYITAKRSYAQALSRALQISDSSTYRLVAVIGPEWKIGDAIDPNNPLNPLTYRCQWKPADIPAATPWTDLHGVSATSNINFSLGLPTGVVAALKSTSAGINFTSQTTGKYSLTGLSGPIIGQDDFETALNTEPCKSARVNPALIIRGVVSGIETFSSNKSIDAGGKITTLNIDVFNLKYVDSNTYEISDKTAAPKFYLLTLDTPNTRGVESNGSKSTGLGAPRSETIQKLESRNVLVPPTQ